MCTYNVHGFNDTKAEYIQQLIDKYDFVLLQEHWLLDSECHVFQDKLPGVVAHCISGMDETSLKAGRGYGGCAILWKSSQVCTIEPVELDNKRVSAVKIKLQDASILLCSIYMPCDVMYDNHNVEIYIAVLDDILTNDICNNVDHVIIGGDFNTDLNRLRSAHTTNLLDICNRENIKCVLGHPKCNIDYTYESMSNHQRSCIDHFIVSEDIYDCIVTCTVLHDGDNLSDHDVVCMELSLNTIYDMVDVEYESKPLWGKATQTNLSEYKHTLDTLLTNINIPVDAVLCKNKFCSMHHDVIQKYHDNIIATIIKASSCIPSTNKNNRQKSIPGWNEFVSEYKEKAMFWHKFWKDNGSPNRGVIFDIRRKTRWQYHRALKLVKRNKENIKAERMANGLSGTGFWSDVKRTLGHSKSLPNTVDGVQGSENIADLFQQKYNELYNSVGYDTHQMAALKREIDDDILCERYDTFKIFTAYDIECNIKFIKTGKSGGTHGHSSDNFIHGTQK